MKGGSSMDKSSDHLRVAPFHALFTGVHTTDLVCR
jgi:hypothetical protein